MKKVTLSVAALAIATSGFSQNVLSREDSSLLAKLEIDGVGSSFNDGDCIGHTFIKYDTSS